MAKRRSTRTARPEPSIAAAASEAMPPPPTGGGRLLALDVSSVCVGWALFDGAQLIDHGRYHQVGRGHAERLVHWQFFLLALLRTTCADRLVVEEPYPGANRNAFRVLMMYQAVVLMAHWQFFDAEMPEAHRLASHMVKRVLRAPRGADHDDNKRIMVEVINGLFGLTLVYKRDDKSKKVSQDDEADAIAVGHTALVQADEVPPPPKSARRPRSAKGAARPVRSVRRHGTRKPRRGA